MATMETDEDLGLLAPMDAMTHPYRGQYPTNATLPKKGVAKEEVLRILSELRDLESPRWREGFASGSVYHGGDDHVDFVAKAYAIHSQTNQLHNDIWPSMVKFEAEIVSMTAHLVGGGADGVPVGSPEGVCGTVTSGGSESILMAMKTYRDWARETKGITEPQIVLPTSAHVAFHKAAHYFGLEMKLVPLDAGFRAEMNAVRDAITPNTIALVGSAMNFPYGTIDPIAEMAALAQEHGIGMHVDGCLGGFFLPWVEKLGRPVPAWNFRVPGVTSLSVDTHKYAYAPKGTSVVLYRGRALRQHQYFTTSDWPGGLYHSPTMAGSRPGGLSAACWAAMIAIGEEGYLEATRRILDAVAVMKAGIDAIPELKHFGESIGAFGFGSDVLDPYQVLDQMSARRWCLTGLQHPAGIHVSPTLRTAQAGVAERFVSDLSDSVRAVKENPTSEGGMAPIYGMAATIPDRTIVHEMLRQLMDVYYRL